MIMNLGNLPKVSVEGINAWKNVVVFCFDSLAHVCSEFGES
jgi:hypothetical protein